VSKLNRLKTPYSELSPDDRLSLILAIRLSRRTSKKPPPTERATKECANKSAVKQPKAALTKMSNADLARLEAELLALMEE
jgi:hypothetical protein